MQQRHLVTRPHFTRFYPFPPRPESQWPDLNAKNTSLQLGKLINDPSRTIPQQQPRSQLNASAPLHPTLSPGVPSHVYNSTMTQSKVFGMCKEAKKTHICSADIRSPPQPQKQSSQKLQGNLVDIKQSNTVTCPYESCPHEI